jgi:hypothetical protein
VIDGPRFHLKASNSTLLVVLMTSFSLGLWKKVALDQAIETRLLEGEESICHDSHNSRLQLHHAMLVGRSFGHEASSSGGFSTFTRRPG